MITISTIVIWIEISLELRCSNIYWHVSAETTRAYAEILQRLIMILIQRHRWLKIWVSRQIAPRNKILIKPSNDWCSKLVCNHAPAPLLFLTFTAPTYYHLSPSVCTCVRMYVDVCGLLYQLKACPPSPKISVIASAGDTCRFHQSGFAQSIPMRSLLPLESSSQFETGKNT